MENALRASSLYVRLQYERRIKDLQEANGAAMLEMRARQKYRALKCSPSN